MHSDKMKARAFALVMHVAFIALLIFGVSWQKKPEAPVVADLWSNLPPMPQPKLDVSLPPATEPPPKPVPRLEPPPPKVEPVHAPKPEIALKRKIEKEKKAEPKPEAKPKPEPKKQDDDKAARLKKEAEAKKLKEDREAQQKQFAAEKEATAKAAAQASEQGKVISEYMERIRSKVRQNIVEPPGLQGNPTAEFDVVLLPGGDVLSVRLARSSGAPAYDAAAERAIMKSAPLPLPPNPELFSRFRDLHLSVRPKQ